MTTETEIISKIKNFSKNIRKKILKMALTAGVNSAHIGGALSITDIISVLFGYKMNLKKIGDKDWDKRDRFILSKGHACLVYYAAMNEVGLLSDNELETFEKDNSNLAGHPVKNKDLGIDFSNGSLGMGLSLGIGLAISSIKRKNSNNIFVILGDGECNEGSIWEVALSAPKFNLDNLCVILDRNNFQQTGSGKEILDLDSLNEKWRSFNWEVIEIDGHNYSDIFNALIKKSSKPKIIIANTIKGKGFSFSEDNNDWHHKILTKNQYEEALEELDK